MCICKHFQLLSFISWGFAAALRGNRFSYNIGRFFVRIFELPPTFSVANSSFSRTKNIFFLHFVFISFYWLLSIAPFSESRQSSDDTWDSVLTSHYNKKYLFGCSELFTFTQFSFLNILVNKTKPSLFIVSSWLDLLRLFLQLELFLLFDFFFKHFVKLFIVLCFHERDLFFLGANKFFEFLLLLLPLEANPIGNPLHNLMITWICSCNNLLLCLSSPNLRVSSYC